MPCEPSSFSLNGGGREIDPRQCIDDMLLRGTALHPLSGIVGRQRQIERDTAAIAAVRHALRQGGLHIVKLTEQVSRDTSIGFKAVRAVIDRYASEDVKDAEALWIKTFIRINNGIHVSLPPRSAS